MSPDPAKAIARAIARNQPRELARALSAAPDNWPELACGRFSCWARVLTCRRRARLWPVLHAAGLSPDTPVRFGGQALAPLALALRHGRFDLVESLLDAGARPDASLGGKPLLEALIEIHRSLARREYAAGSAARPPLAGDWTWPAFSRRPQALAATTGRLLDAGAPVTPATLSAWLILAARDPAGPWAGYCRRAHAAGARPVRARGDDLPSSRSLVPVAVACARMQEAWAWDMLADELRATRPTPDLVLELARHLGGRQDLEAADGEPAFAGLVAFLVRHWPPLAPGDWTQDAQRSWRRRFGKPQVSAHGSFIWPCMQAACVALDWALGNAVPQALLLEGDDALVPALLLMIQRADNAPGEDRAWRVLARVLEALPQGLETPCAGKTDRTLRARLRDQATHWQRIASPLERANRIAMARRLAARLPEGLPASRARM